MTAFWPKGECSVNEQIDDLLQLGHEVSESKRGPGGRRGKGGGHPPTHG